MDSKNAKEHMVKKATEKTTTKAPEISLRATYSLILEFYGENFKRIALWQFVYAGIFLFLMYGLSFIDKLLVDFGLLQSVEIGIGLCIFIATPLIFLTLYFHSYSKICYSCLDNEPLALKDHIPSLYIFGILAVDFFCIVAILFFSFVGFIIATTVIVDFTPIRWAMRFRDISQILMPILLLVGFPPVMARILRRRFMVPFLMTDRGMHNSDANKLSKVLTQDQPKLKFALSSPVYIATLIGLVGFYFFSLADRYLGFFSLYIFFLMSFFGLSVVITSMCIFYRVMSSEYFDDMTAPEEVDNWKNKPES